MQRRGPYFLITALLLILFFIVGIRYGQSVEKKNQEISQKLSITPSPTPLVNLSNFELYKSEVCSLEFLYPSSLDLIEKTTQSAELESKNEIIFSFFCDKEEAEEVFFKIASPESGM
ncbi:MAG TPA: hypothetical protein VGA67_04970 [Candidatus Dojkabacteria bacterium]